MSKGGGSVGKSASSDFKIPTLEEARDLAVGLDAGGLRSNFDAVGGQRRIGIESSGERDNVVTGMSDTFRSRANQLRGLLPQVAPGTSELRKAQLAQLESARSRTVGNLSETLSRRRVRGSSFANDSIARTEAEFGKERASIAAATKLEELRLTTEFIQEIGNMDQQAYATKLTEMNLQADVALKLSAMTSQITAQAANTASQIEISNAQLETSANQQSDGSGQLIGSLVGAAASIGVGAMTGGVGGAAMAGALAAGAAASSASAST